MTYKIRILTKNDGSIIYDSYRKYLFFFWQDISAWHRSKREEALADIDNDFGRKTKSILFEYIKK